ncbi:unnamed protein product [Dovyalis caffra]|uniref:Uncharacterized protein n=1 Tax=Dovyalis caffra TaxID=77055 RepID=A0AAV1QT45_9ROSI|nr:unnamed protein product [Dovyalis caffra]
MGEVLKKVDMEKIQDDLDNELEVAGNSFLNDNKAMYDGVLASAGLENTSFGGRKMMFESLMRKEMIKQGLNEAEKENSGAVHFVENCDPNYREKGALHVKCRMSSRKPLPMKKNMVRFTAFNADYNVPKSHPPRNN